MNIEVLKNALGTMKSQYESVISTATYNGKTYPNGQRAKLALVTSSNFILNLHEVGKIGLEEAIRDKGFDFRILPPVGQRGPEASIYGFLKPKKQDIVLIPNNLQSHPSKIAEGPMMGRTDPVGKIASESSIVIGVRSQLSSIDKNFDTLMERSFAETLNLRLRLPGLVMGEIYLIPVYEYNQKAMVNNEVAFVRNHVKIEKFISTFLSISNRLANPVDEDLYKYERTALILVDFQQNPPKLFLTTEELKGEGLIPNDFDGNYDLLSPSNFGRDLINIYSERHNSIQ